MGRGRRPGLSFVKRREALREEDPSLGSRAASEGGDGQPRPTEVHLLRGPGTQRATTRREPAQPQALAQLCSPRPRPGPGPAHCRGRRRERVAGARVGQWAQDPRPCGLRGLQGDPAHHPGSDPDRRGWQRRSSRARTLADSKPAVAPAIRPPPTVRGRNEQRRATGAGPPGEAVPTTHKAAPTPRSATRQGASAAPPARYRQRLAAPTGPGELEHGAVALPGAVPAVGVHTLEGGSSGHGAKGRGRLAQGERRGDWDQPACTAPQSPPATLHEPLPLWGSPDSRFIGLRGPTLRGPPLANLKGSLRSYWFPAVLITVRHQHRLRWPGLSPSPAPFLYRDGPL